jgi:hypothetical protein
MMNPTQRITLRRIASLLAIPVLASALLGASGLRHNDPVITVNSNSRVVPSELNPGSGGAPNATPAQAAAFA